MGARVGGAGRLLPRHAWTSEAWVSEEPSASCPIDFVALPPDCVQPVLATGAGRLNGRACVAGSTSMSPSLVSTGMRSPSTGVLGPDPFLNTEHPLAAKAAAIMMAILIFFDLVILGPTGPAVRGPRWRRCQGSRQSGLSGRGPPGGHPCPWRSSRRAALPPASCPV